MNNIMDLYSPKYNNNTGGESEVSYDTDEDNNIDDNVQATIKHYFSQPFPNIQLTFKQLITKYIQHLINNKNDISVVDHLSSNIKFYNNEDIVYVNFYCQLLYDEITKRHRFKINFKYRTIPINLKFSFTVIIVKSLLVWENLMLKRCDDKYQNRDMYIKWIIFDITKIYNEVIKETGYSV